MSPHRHLADCLLLIVAASSSLVLVGIWLLGRGQGREVAGLVGRRERGGREEGGRVFACPSIVNGGKK